uniref:pantothenate kinase 1 n=1 Tax=Erigeron canadensis TaxID=72917 RepID=UPI001CB8F127|nr:pantothenate kinase 1 [Erigeron canadensis]
MEGGGDRIEEEVTIVNSPADQISHLALDIGGSLIKMVYFSTSREQLIDNTQNNSSRDSNEVSKGSKKRCLINGRLYFIMFETSKINECLDFIASKQLHNRGVHHCGFPASDTNTIKATGGGAFRFADLFKEKLGIILDKVEEMSSLVSGVNFLLKAVPSEAFTYENGKRNYVQIDHNDLYPYLLVNIGSGVSMIKVDGDGKYERVSGTSVGGGTFWGLGKLLTKCKSFDDLLEMSHRGNNRVIDMLVGDIYGGMDYLKIGLSSTTIASSFGKAVSENKELEEYKPEDVARSLLRMISNNIGQIAYLNALRFGLKKIFFGGYFIRGHAYTMDTISVAVDFWSKGEAKAMFLRHEGFLGALGAFMNYEAVEGFPNSVCPIREKTSNPFVGDLNDNGIIECCVQATS